MRYLGPVVLLLVAGLSGLVLERDREDAGVVPSAARIPLGGFELFRSFFTGLLVIGFSSEVEQYFGILEIGSEGVEEPHFALDESLFAENLFGGIPVVPEIGPGCLGLERIEALAQRSDVKDASGVHRIESATCAIDL